MKNSEEIQCYTQDEIKELLDKKERLVFVKTRDEEVIARYEDIPDVIIDFFNKFVYTNMEFYDYETAEEILTTFGPFLHKCKPEVREDIIGRLEKLQKHEIEVKDYKIVHEEDMGTVIGRGGKMASAIRVLIQAAAYNMNIKRVRINIDSF